jgi:hypothetical protein
MITIIRRQGQEVMKYKSQHNGTYKCWLRDAGGRFMMVPMLLTAEEVRALVEADVPYYSVCRVREVLRSLRAHP